MTTLPLIFATFGRGQPHALLGWIFLQPLPVDRYWILLVLPLVVGIAVVYKAIKLNDLSQLPRQAARLTGMIIAFMILAAAVLWVVSEVL